MALVHPMAYALIPALPALWQWRGGGAAGLFGTVALGFAMLAMWQLYLSPPTPLEFSTPKTGTKNGPALHDTYYVMSHSRYVITLAFVFAVLWLAFWLKAIWIGGADRAVIWLFWIFFCAVLIRVSVGSFFAHWGMPRRYIDYPQAFAWLNSMTALSSFLAMLALIGLLWTYFHQIARHLINARGAR